MYAMYGEVVSGAFVWVWYFRAKDDTVAAAADWRAVTCFCFPSGGASMVRYLLSVVTDLVSTTRKGTIRETGVPLVCARMTATRAVVDGNDTSDHAISLLSPCDYSS